MNMYNTKQSSHGKNNSLLSMKNSHSSVHSPSRGQQRNSTFGGTAKQSTKYLGQTPQGQVQQIFQQQNYSSSKGGERAPPEVLRPSTSAELNQSNIQGKQGGSRKTNNSVFAQSKQAQDKASTNLMKGMRSGGQNFNLNSSMTRPETQQTNDRQDMSSIGHAMVRPHSSF